MDKITDKDLESFKQLGEAPEIDDLEREIDSLKKELALSRQELLNQILEKARKCQHSQKELASVQVPNIFDQLVHENRGGQRVIDAIEELGAKV